MGMPVYITANFEGEIFATADFKEALSKLNENTKKYLTQKTDFVDENGNLLPEIVNSYIISDEMIENGQVNSETHSIKIFEKGTPNFIGAYTRILIK